MGSVQRILTFWASGTYMTMLDCCVCTVRFGITQALETQLRASDGWFHCPMGHQQHFTQIESAEARELQKTKRLLENAQADARRQRELREFAERQTKGANIAAGKAKAALRRTLTRVHAGVCPHCNRTFAKLAAHMRSKHSQTQTQKTDGAHSS